MKFVGKHILSVSEFDRAAIERVFAVADQMEPYAQRKKATRVLEGAILGSMFFEPSTRTRVSFGCAFNLLGGEVRETTELKATSIAKGESFYDTARVLSGYSDVIVMRHQIEGSVAEFSEASRVPVINGGDGANEHPSQALLDLLTIRDHKGSLEGLKVAIVGDISHSRVARSNIRAMQTMGMKVRVVGPPPLIPPDFECLGVEVSHNLREAVRDVDVVMVLRIQIERQSQGLLSSLREYSNYFCLTSESLAKARDDVLIIHPGPVNRGVEIALDVMESPRSLILNQVTSGVSIRMALFYLLLGENNANPN